MLSAQSAACFSSWIGDRFVRALPVFLPSLSCPVQALGLSAVRVLALLPGRYFDFLCFLYYGIVVNYCREKSV
jgi:hypothetical protein